MFCLRSWLPLLFIPTNASPAFIFLFFICTYFLNRPCVYCSFLLLILFLTSCNWSDRCFFDFSSNWFQPRPPTSLSTSPIPDIDPNASFNATVVEVINSTASALAGAAAEELARQRPAWASSGCAVSWDGGNGGSSV
uniref:Uncharacterized protein n=1 Tax=Colletotrichum fructicola (strain Nara gc5) TaxID=1213859 RepID=L2GJR5_COLFN